MVTGLGDLLVIHPVLPLVDAYEGNKRVCKVSCSYTEHAGSNPVLNNIRRTDGCNKKSYKENNSSRN